MNNIIVSEIITQKIKEIQNKKFVWNKYSNQKLYNQLKVKRKLYRVRLNIRIESNRKFMN